MKPRISTTVERPPPSNPLSFLRTNMGGIWWFLRETGRNAINHGKAQNIAVRIYKVRPTDPEPILEILDDGIGMGEDARWLFHAIGWSNEGNGTGARKTAVMLGQRLEVHTVHVDEPTVAWRTVMPLLQFVIDVHMDRSAVVWEKVSRKESRLPESHSHGTLLILSDFRAPKVQNLNKLWKNWPPRLDTFEWRSTVDQITEEKAREHIAHEFRRPSQARLFVVNGTRIKPRPLAGLLVWPESEAKIKRVKTSPGLGEISGEIRLAPTSSETWLDIGGSTTTMSMRTFLTDLRVHNQELSRQVPAVWFDKRLIGYLQIGALENSWATEDREHLVHDFYVSAEARMLVDELVAIGGVVAEKVREIESQPQSDVAESLLAEVLATMHASQGIKPTAVSDGTREGPGASGGAVPVPPPPRLMVDPSQIKLELWDGGPHRDAAIVAVRNAMPDEEFEWRDLDRAGLFEPGATGNQITVRAARRKGVYLIAVASKQYPTRERTLRVEVSTNEEVGPAPKVDEFSLIPRGTSTVVGERRLIRVRAQGTSSGQYDWQVAPATDKKERIAEIAVRPGGREVEFVGFRHGYYEVICTDVKDRSLVARSRVQVLARIEEEDDGGDDVVCGVPYEGGGIMPIEGGTGDDSRERGSHMAGQPFTFVFRGTTWQFTARTDASVTDPFYVDQHNRRILVSSGVLMRFVEKEARMRHMVSCVADGIASLLFAEHVLIPEDHAGFTELMKTILDIALPQSKEVGNGNGGKK